MSLTHAILGLLRLRPMTGYDLKTTCFDESITHFWPADQAQIYRTLDKLTEQGLVESHVEFQESRPNRKVYNLTDAGRAELARWLASPQALPAYRDAFLIQLFFSAQLSNNAIIKQMRHQLELHHKRLNLALSVEPLPPEDPTPERDRRLQWLTLELGIMLEQTYIEWLEKSIEVVRHLEE